MIADIMTSLFIALGGALGIVGGLGMHRFPDFYSRLHAVGVTDTLCSFLVLSGLSFQSGLSLESVKLFLIFAFLLFTSPTSSFSLASAAWVSGMRPQGVTFIDATEQEERQQ